MTMLYVAVGAVLLLILAVVAIVHYAKKSEREKIRKWLAEQAVERDRKVIDELSKPLPSDADFLDDVRERSGLSVSED